MADPFLDTPVQERTVAAALAKQVRDRPNSIAIVDEDENNLTFAGAQRAAFRVATALSELGVGRQEPVLVMLDNHTDRVVAWLGISVGAMVEVPINTAYRGEMLRHIIADSGARTLIIEGKWLDRIRDIPATVGNLDTVVVRGEPNAALPEPIRVERFARLFASEPLVPVPPAVWDIAAIAYTSGTEGRTKGVLCPHGHAFATGSYPTTVGPGDVVMVTLPLFHVSGLWLQVYGAIRDGACAAIVRHFSASRFWASVRRFGATTTFLLGASADFLYRQPASPHDRGHTLRTVEFIPASALVDAFEERFGVSVVTSYGQTEAGTVCSPQRDEIKPFALGRPRPHVEMKIVDDNDIEVVPGTAGEIVLRSREPWTMMSGYHGMPEATAHAWRNLWLHTGDSGYQDEHGTFFFIDRKKDALRRRGENVSSYEVEQCIVARKDIADAAVVAVPSEHTEDEIKAFIVMEPGNEFNIVDVVQDLAKRLPYFMVPRYYEVTDELPRTATFKVRKDLLRANAGENSWDCKEHGIAVTRDGFQLLAKRVAK
jgi:carnitine-CoA ligase